MIFGYMIFLEKEIRFRFFNIFIKTGDLLQEYIRTSMPVLVSDLLIAVGDNFVRMIIGRMGNDFIVGKAITTAIVRLCTVEILGISQASSVITGNTLGAGGEKEAVRQGYGFLGIGILFGGVSALLIILIIKPVLMFYGLVGEAAATTIKLLTASAIVLYFRRPTIFCLKERCVEAEIQKY